MNKCKVCLVPVEGEISQVGGRSCGYFDVVVFSLEVNLDLCVHLQGSCCGYCNAWQILSLSLSLSENLSLSHIHTAHTHTHTHSNRHCHEMNMI